MTTRIIRFVAGLAALVVVSAGLWRAYRPWQRPTTVANQVATTPSAAGIDGTMPVRVSREARKNMGLISKPAQPSTYWRKIDVPGIITDRPGVSDRGVVAPVTGIVTGIHAYPGDTITPGAPLVSLR